MIALKYILGLLLLLLIFDSCGERKQRTKKKMSIAYEKIYKQCKSYSSLVPDNVGSNLDACSCISKVVSNDFDDRLSLEYLMKINNSEIKLQFLKTLKDDKPRSKIMRCYAQEYGLTERQATNIITAIEVF